MAVRVVLVLCACLLTEGALLAVIASANPLPSWSARVLVDPGSIFRDVSCPSTSLCVAVDTAGDVLTSTDPDGGAPAWTLAHVDGTNALRSVWCVGSALCIAVDTAGNVVTSTDPTGGAGSWHVVNTGSSSELNGVTCTSVSLCVAVNAAGDVVTSTEPTGESKAWTVTKVKGSSVLDGVTCTPSALCVAVGNEGLLFTTTEPTGGSPAWHSAHVDGNNGLDRVACPSASLCVAVDADENVVTSTEPTGGASAWKVDEFDPGGGDVEGISCPSTSQCVAVDGRGGALVTIEPAGPAAWTRTVIDESIGLSGVSCPLAGLCVAVDEAGGIVTAGAWRHSVSVLAQGSGAGSVTSSPGGISCPATCSSGYPTGTQVTLNAAAAPGSTFAGWSGGCTGTGSCQLTLEGDVAVTATFNALPPTQRTLTVQKSGNGTVQSSPAGIDCGAVCSAAFTIGQQVTLTAKATPPSRFARWTGACTTSSPTCTITLAADQSVTATFLAPPLISRLSIAPPAFRAAANGPSTQNPSRAGKRGAQVRYLLTEPATVRFRVERLLPGRRTRTGPRARCLTETRSNRKAPRCTRTVALRGSFTVAGRAGVNTLHFTGRLSGATLTPGRYVLTATPTAEGIAGNTARAAFSVTP